MGLSEKIELTTGLNCTLLCLVQFLAYSRAIFFPNCTQTHVGYLYIKVVNTVVLENFTMITFSQNSRSAEIHEK